jgi:hypothetical protein
MHEFHPRATAYIASLPVPQKEICASLRALILEAFPQMREEFKWNYPAYYYDGKRICLISGFKNHVTVELFHGAHLRDTQGRVAGAGRNARHLKLKSLEDIDPDYLVDLLRQSIVYQKASHAADGGH